MRYKVYQSHANNGTKGKFYLRPVYDETVELDQLADHMASHNTPFSKGQLLAVLTDSWVASRSCVWTARR